MKRLELMLLGRALRLCVRIGAYADWLTPRIARRLKRVAES